MPYSDYIVTFTDSAPVRVMAYSRENAIDKALNTSKFPYWKAMQSKTQRRKSVVSAKKLNK